MLAETTQRVERNTSPGVNQQFEERLRDNLTPYLNADRAAIDRRLAELDKEWNIERFIETEAPLMIGLGIALGLTRGRKWFGLSAMAASMVILHGTQGWYPLLPIFRRIGVRTQNEIEEERNALRVLRGDHKAYRATTYH